MGDRLERLAETAAAWLGKLVPLTVKLDRCFAREHLSHDLDVLARARERLAVVVAVPALRDLRPGGTEPEHEPAAGEMIEGERRHCHRRRRTRRKLTDRSAELDPRRRRTPPHERCERVGAVRLRGPHRIDREPLRFGERRGHVARRLRAPITEHQAKFHGVNLTSIDARTSPSTDSQHANPSAWSATASPTSSDSSRPARNSISARTTRGRPRCASSCSTGAQYAALFTWPMTS